MAELPPDYTISQLHENFMKDLRENDRNHTDVIINMENRIQIYEKYHSLVEQLIQRNTEKLQQEQENDKPQ
jgi:hypothetical protein